MDKVKIIIARSFKQKDKYVAEVEGKPELFAYGITSQTAVNNLVVKNIRKFFDIKFDSE